MFAFLKNMCYTVFEQMCEVLVFVFKRKNGGIIYGRTHKQSEENL